VLTQRSRPRWGSREVWFVQEALRRVAGYGDLRPSRDHVASDLGIQALSAVSSSRSDPQSDGRQESAAGVSSESKRAVALRHFSHRPRRIFRCEEGACRGK
jgi:hypothetical protein